MITNDKFCLTRWGELPARDVGVLLEPALVERLLADAGDEPGVLPFVQETLVMLWSHADRYVIGLDPYTNLVGDKSGRSGLQVALAEHADDVYRSVLANDAERAVAKRILLRLIQFGEGRADTRRQQTADELRKGISEADGFERVLSTMTANRLVTLSDEARRVDISHEALIRGWPRLRDWIHGRRAAELTRRRLEEKAGERLRLRQGEDGEGGLLDAVELAEAEAWVGGPDAIELGVSDELANLVADSRRAINAAKRLRRLNQALAVALAAALLATTVAVVFFFSAQDEAKRAMSAEALAQEETKRAVSAEARAKDAQAETAKLLEQVQIGESRLLNNLAVQQLTQDPVASIYLSLRSLPSAGITRPLVAEAQSTLVQAVRISQERKYLPLMSGGVLSQIYLTPKNIALGQSQGSTAGGQPIVTAGDKLYFVSSDLDSVSSSELGDGAFGGFAWGDGGKLLVSTDNAVSVWQDGRRQATFGAGAGSQDDNTGNAPIACATWPQSADRIAICRGNAVWLWQPDVGTKRMLSSNFRSVVRNTAWSPDGSRLAAWDEGAQIASATDGSTIAQVHTLWVWDALAGKTVVSDTVAGEPIWSAAWSSDGRLLVTATTSNTATIWNLAGEPVTKTIGVCLGTGGVRFVDDQHFIVWSTGGSGQLWDTEGNRIEPPATEIACPMDDGGVANMLLLGESGGNRQFLKVHNSGAFELWEPVSKSTVRFRGHTMNVLAADRRNQYLATGSQDGTIRIWDAATGEAISVLRGHKDVNGDARAEVIAVKWRDDQRLLSAGEDGSWRIWQVFDRHGEPLCTDTDQFGLPICMEANSTLRRVDDQVRLEEIRSAAWLNDDEIGAFSTLMTGENNIAVRWNVATNAVSAVPITKTVAAAFWLPGGILLSEKKGNVRLLDPATRVETPLPGYATQVTAASQQPDGLLATGDVSGTVRIWDTKKNELLNQWDGGTAAINTLQWSKDGTRLLSAGNRVSLWEVGADAAVLTWPSLVGGGGEGFKRKKMYAALTPDEKTLAIVFDEGVLVLDAQSRKQCWRKADMYDQPILGVAWVTKGDWPNQSPQQSAAATGCDAARDPLLLTWGGDGTAKVWDLLSNAAVMSISEGPKKSNPQIQIVAASPSGEYLFTAGSSFHNGINGVIRRWKAWYQNPQELLDEAAQAKYMTRELSAAQLAAFSLEQ